MINWLTPTITMSFTQRRSAGQDMGFSGCKRPSEQLGASNKSSGLGLVNMLKLILLVPLFMGSLAMARLGEKRNAGNKQDNTAAAQGGSVVPPTDTKTEGVLGSTASFFGFLKASLACRSHFGSRTTH
ncbi:unnamed protein product [Amoebophrya sp. A25]|nr:unnamed protein product [Amoebophrya sp. A25]|eukprot:GSA25T00009281001.1